MPKSGRVKAKKRCCKSGPRCKRCPVVLKRLEKAGMAAREGKRIRVLVGVAKPAMKAARVR